MPLRHDPLPQDTVQLTRIILSLNEENADLKARVAFLERLLFGTKSEKMTIIDPTQAMLDLGHVSDIPVAANDDVAPVGEDKTPARRSPARNIGRLPKYLPRYDEIIEPESKTCPCCSFELHCIGTDVSEALDIVPAVVRVRRTIRPRYACRACESVVVQASAPARVMDGGMVTTGVCRACRCFEVCLASPAQQTGADAGLLRRHDRSRHARRLGHVGRLVAGASLRCAHRLHPLAAGGIL
ncbi:transposase [Rhizobium tropici]|uniref:Transposase n=3 Tax=Rhizobium TaxID=379 RepID=A0ABR6R9J3_RHITR|nr:transposase [Rhizobium tropici]MBB5596806.1 transposase [Rhizobium tropici]MBB6489542.1 transposase [Rhizobium lusitanum]MBB6495859.1 transposase [Rhizobium tropici]